MTLIYQVIIKYVLNFISLQQKVIYLPLSEDHRKANTWQDLLRLYFLTLGVDEEGSELNN